MFLLLILPSYFINSEIPMGKKTIHQTDVFIAFFIKIFIAYFFLRTFLTTNADFRKISLIKYLTVINYFHSKILAILIFSEMRSGNEVQILPLSNLLPKPA